MPAFPAHSTLLQTNGTDPFVVLAIAVVMLVALALVALRTAALYGSVDENEVSPSELTNCPECGSRVAVESDVCDYCGASMTDDPDEEPFG